MKNILSSIMERLNEFSERTAQAIRDSDWKIVARSVGIALAAILFTLALVMVILPQST